MTDQEFDNRVRLAIYDFFVTSCRAPVAAELASGLEARPFDVEEAFRRLADAHVIVLAPGTPHLWMANPFSAVPTPFRVSADGRGWWGNCIWDSLGIMAMLGSDGSVKTFCPDCGDPMAVTARKGALLRPEGIVHYTVPAARWWDDIGFN